MKRTFALKSTDLKNEMTKVPVLSKELDDFNDSFDKRTQHVEVVDKITDVLMVVISDAESLPTSAVKEIRSSAIPVAPLPCSIQPCLPA